jgi:arylsulfatase A-like enzyme
MPPGIDLASRFVLAETRAEIAEIDSGEFSRRSAFVSSWGKEEKWGTTSFVWSLGEQSTVRFYINRLRRLEIEISCWAFVTETLPMQTVIVTCNGLSVGTIQLSNRYGPGDTYQLELPESSLLVGDNQLTFTYGYVARPVDHGINEDNRQLAVAWSWLRFRGIKDIKVPFIGEEEEASALTLPVGSEVRYYLQVSPEDEIVVAEISGAGWLPSDARLELVVEPMDDPATTTVLEPEQWSQGPIHLPLKVSQETIARLTLRASLADTGRRTRGRLILRQPMLSPGSAERVALSTSAVSLPVSGRPNIVIYTIDALRADHLGCYGYQKPTSPQIDAFASDATLFANLVAQSSWTKSTIASLFTGLLPSTHQANTAEESLPEGVETLAERAQELGYQTAGFTTNGVVGAMFGFNQGFESYETLSESMSTKEIHQLSDQLHQAAVSWLDNRDVNRPFLLYLHSTDPHSPYYPREPFRNQFAGGVDPAIGEHSFVTSLTQNQRAVTEGLAEQLVSLYDAEIAFNDASFGMLVDELKKRGLYDQTILVLCSDHGEEFFDHGRWEHGLSLYQEQLHIPLIIRFPDGRGAGQTIADPVQQIDIMPTLLAAVGGSAGPGVQGRSFLGLVDQTERGTVSRPIYSELSKVKQRRVEIVRVGDLKLIHNITYDRPRPVYELYDLASDPGEQQQPPVGNPILLGYLKSVMAAARSKSENRFEAVTVDLDPELAAQLEALGYLGDGAP